MLNRGGWGYLVPGPELPGPVLVALQVGGHPLGPAPGVPLLAGHQTHHLLLHPEEGGQLVGRAEHGPGCTANIHICDLCSVTYCELFGEGGW